MSLFWPPSLRTCEGSRRSSHDRLLLRLYAPPSVEFSPRSAGQSRSPLNKITDSPSAAADFCNKIGTFRLWPVWLTTSVHEAKAEVSFERPEVRW